MIPRMKLEGAEELKAGLDELKGTVAKKVVRDSITDSLIPVQNAAIGTVHRRSGRLQRSIGIGTKLTKRQSRVSERLVSRKGVEAYVGPGVVGGKYDGRHGHLLEFGTRHSAPYPFMRPAWASNLQAVFSRLAGNMAKNLARAAARAAKKALKAGKR